MNKIAVVYWSGTGNTEAMAKAIVEGAKKNGGDADLIFCTDFKAEMMKDYYGIAFGCPSMGAEVLEEIDFDPMWQECKKSIGGKRIALFGSYGWGDGEWMRNWADDASGSGANMVCDFVIANEEPNAEAIAECEKLAAALIA